VDGFGVAGFTEGTGEEEPEDLGEGAADDDREGFGGAAEADGLDEAVEEGVGIGSRHLPVIHASPLGHFSYSFPEHGSPWDNVFVQIPQLLP